MVGLIIPAAGTGERLRAGVPKALYTLGDDPLLIHAIRAGISSGVVTAVTVAAPIGEVEAVRKLLEPEVPGTVGLRVVEGGASRQASVHRALRETPREVDVLLVHDAARCLAPASLFADVANAIAAGRPAVVPGLPVIDTLKQVDAEGAVLGTPDRSALQAVQTPQGFRRDVLERAHRAAEERGEDAVTDDAGLVESIGCPVYVIPGHEDALKITRPLDLVLAEALVARRTSGEQVRTTSPHRRSAPSGSAGA
ncbi:2-C-methyl-D-erythritol 4-phosphate cytidylyltransferase [Phytoactinopolyspora endophytica]|uniref:2-C-methyl-D-erythritol 4-phosphate cytidylyltransferase n=1 Tax=Phytoactinopolyspora endophytica TaxID=1642495 RepID=UPI00101DDADB|nr:2-C-methyl-D-erythritol 4-phosphate cytidylyltransferase [Phytoactinopolyspora endophytica]